MHHQTQTKVPTEAPLATTHPPTALAERPPAAAV